MCLGLKKTHMYTLEEAVGDATVDYDALKRTPMDFFLYYRRCCFCIRLPIASALVCILCFFWGITDLIAADKYIARICPDKGKNHKFIKLFYQIFIFSFLVASIVFAAGLIKKSFTLIEKFIWFAFVFHIIYISIYWFTVSALVYRNVVTRRVCFRIIGCVFWNFLFCYLLIIVNSYRISLWIYSQICDEDYFLETVK